MFSIKYITQNYQQEMHLSLFIYWLLNQFNIINWLWRGRVLINFPRFQEFSKHYHKYICLFILFFLPILGFIYIYIYVGGLLLRRRSSKQKHLRQDDMQAGVTWRCMPKLQMKELRHDDTLETKGGTDLKGKRLHNPW
jgi:hypothetical protein